MNTTHEEITKLKRIIQLMEKERAFFLKLDNARTLREIFSIRPVQNLAECSELRKWRAQR